MCAQWSPDEKVLQLLLFPDGGAVMMVMEDLLASVMLLTPFVSQLLVEVQAVLAQREIPLPAPLCRI